METTVKVIVGGNFSVMAKRENGVLTLEVPQRVFDFVTGVKEGENLELSASTLLTGGKSFINNIFKKSKA